MQLKTKFTLLFRQRRCISILFLLLVSCSGTPSKIGPIGAVENFFGAAISEEPRAALAARDTLSMGGTAADAAVTAFFVMTVTYPVAVGLGGGGVCIYYDHESNKTETLDFRAANASAGGNIAVPGTLRGLALLHSRYGRLPWSKLVTPAETMARFGHQITRALVKRLRPQANRLSADRAAKQIFLRANRFPLDESETILQVELASVLARIRTRGVSDIYGGNLGQRFVEAAAHRGGRLSISDLRKYRAVWRGTMQTPVGNHTLHFPDIGKDNKFGQNVFNSIISKSPKLFEPRIFREGKLTSAIDEGQAGLVISDSSGSAVACVFDMGSAFGVAFMVPELGFFMTPADKSGSRGLALLGVNKHLSQTMLAVAGAGGHDSDLVVSNLAINVMGKGQALNGAMSKKNDGRERIQAIWCPKGIRTTPESCQFATDSQWHGLAAFDTF